MTVSCKCVAIESGEVFCMFSLRVNGVGQCDRDLPPYVSDKLDENSMHCQSSRELNILHVDVVWTNFSIGFEQVIDLNSMYAYDEWNFYLSIMECVKLYINYLFMETRISWNLRVGNRQIDEWLAIESCVFLE